MAADDQEALVRAATEAVLAKLRAGPTSTFKAPVGVSGPHVHLAPGDLATLFGPGTALTVARPLLQPAQFAAEETVSVIGPRSSLANVRVVGPTRRKTVVELTAGDLERLGLSLDVRAGEPFAVVLAGPAGVVRFPEGGVVARRHLHATPADAEKYGLADGAVVSARMGAPGRRVTFGDVLVRVSESAALELHVDRDEANACGARTGDAAEIVVAASPRAAPSPPVPSRAKRPLITEADVVDAYRQGLTPEVSGAILTPYARDALRKYFPELLKVLE
jgi:putative phosphotransacetylase